MEKDIEKIIMNYGTFRENMGIALSFDDSMLARDAWKVLDEMYSLMSEKEFSEQFPEVYATIEEMKGCWNTRSRR
ncbi:hypothetical protein KAT36_01475 [Candidatus Pacearchaeota archaeon]|nr:hypothetical protein [Candidatus Pacearchaeota archaeon]